MLNAVIREQEARERNYFYTFSIWFNNFPLITYISVSTSTAVLWKLSWKRALRISFISFHLVSVYVIKISLLIVSPFSLHRSNAAQRLNSYLFHFIKIRTKRLMRVAKENFISDDYWMLKRFHDMNVCALNGHLVW